MTDVTFHFDPACPWTWRASCWLRQVAERRGLSVEWASLSLSIVNAGKIPEQYRAPLEASSAALRLVEALRAEGRHDDADRFYREMGARSHDKGEPISAEAVRAAVAAAGLTADAGALDDPRWDEAVRSAHEAAFASAGPDIGSPVLMVAGVERGLHGPILGEVPGPEESLAIWDALRPLLRSPAFFEVKRGRR